MFRTFHTRLGVILLILCAFLYLFGNLAGGLSTAIALENGTPAHFPLVLKEYPSQVSEVTLTPTLNFTDTPLPPTPTQIQTPTSTLTSTEVITSSTFYLWSGGVIETSPGGYVVSRHTCYTGCSNPKRWDISLMGDMVGHEYEVFGKFVFYSVRDYSIPFRIILVHDGVEQTLVEYTLIGPGNKELTDIKWQGPDPTSTLGDRLIFEIDVTGEVGTLEIYYMGESSGIRVPVVSPSPQDTRFTSLFALPGNADAIDSVDLDGDGDMDLVGSDYNNQDINWWENNGSGSFTKHVIDDDETSLDIPMDNSVYAEDIDSDGDIDVLSIVDSSSTYEISWYDNNGSEQFSKQDITTNSLNPHSVYAIDLDQDGDIDILGGGYTLTWFQNDSNQVFTKQDIDTINGISCVSAIDLDQDGLLDILAATQTGGIYWWQNNGTQTFTRNTIRTGSSTTFGSRSWVVGGDLDGDGDNDVIGTAALDSEIAWWENDGHQNFTEHVISDGIGNPVSVSIGDLDNDADLDILAGGAVTAWWENIGDQRFIRHTISSSSVKSLVIADIDKDGDMDFFKSNSLLTWSENNEDG